MTAVSDERHARYRAGICTDCGEKPHSAGRPRCETCHQKHITAKGAGTSS